MTEAPSVFEPVSKALDWTGKVLFRPFEIEKWLVLGFCAWLAWLGEQSYRNAGNWNHGSGRDFRDSYDEASNWLLEHLTLIVIVVVFILVLSLAFGLLLQWLSSRGKFMFLDGVLHDRAAVKEPWRCYRMAGNSLFGLRAVVTIGLFLLFVIDTAALLVAVLPFDPYDIRPGVIAAFVIWLLILLAIGFTGALFSMTVTDFIVPIMWIRNCRVKEAWSECMTVVGANLGTFILYVLFKILMAVCFAIIGCISVCLTCCLVAVPYIGTVILLPLFVFHRSYSSYFMAQFSPDYAALAPVFVTRPPAAGV